MIIRVWAAGKHSYPLKATLMLKIVHCLSELASILYLVTLGMGEGVSPGHLALALVASQEKNNHK